MIIQYLQETDIYKMFFVMSVILNVSHLIYPLHGCFENYPFD